MHTPLKIQKSKEILLLLIRVQCIQVYGMCDDDVDGIYLRNEVDWTDSLVYVLVLALALGVFKSHFRLHY